VEYNLEQATCELCGSTKAKVFWNKNAHKCLSVTIKDDKDIGIHNVNVICKNCGLVYTSPRMTKDTLDEFYRTTYRTIYGSNAEQNIIAERNHAMKGLEILFGSKIKRMFGPTRFLDVGCSTGQFVEIYKQAMIQNRLPVQATGIEASEDYSRLGQGRGNRIINEDFLQWETEENFDIITIMNTLEHMYSPVATLQKIHELLDVGGHVLISVPNIENVLVSRNMDAFMSNAHLYNFSPQTLISMLQKTGFEPVAIHILFEEIGEKIYALAKKAEPQEPDFDVINPMVDDRIRMAKIVHELAVLKTRLMGLEAKDGN
jgi:SAM-dependent methyltransferase